MLASIWNRGSAIFLVLRYHLYHLTHFRIPALFTLRPLDREKPGDHNDDFECCEGHVNRGRPGSRKYRRRCAGVYEPVVGEIFGEGSTCHIARVAPGVIIKYPRFSWWYSEIAALKWFVRNMKRSFEVEERPLEIIGLHPRIIQFKGHSNDPFGLLFAEASDGNLQKYIDQHHHSIGMSLRLKWRTQAAEAIQFIHSKGVIHSDLRPDNFLLHTVAGSALDLLLCDFGGSTNGEIDGGHLPDFGFSDPCGGCESTPSTDIFSLGSIYYTIMTGHWPYRTASPFKSMEEIVEYEEKVEKLFSTKTYPSVDELPAGVVIQRCWTGEYSNAKELIEDQHRRFESLMQ